MTWQAKTGEVPPNLRMCLSDLNGAVDMSTATEIKVYILKTASSEVLEKDGVADPDQLTNKGYIEVEWEAGDIDVRGNYRVESKVTFASGKIQKFPTKGWEILEVDPELGAFCG